jgi:hypothetical protein
MGPEGGIERPQQFVDLGIGEDFRQRCEAPVRGSRDCRQQRSHAIACEGAEPQVTADRAARHADGAGTPPGAVPEDELPDRSELDTRDQDRASPEHSGQEPRHDRTALLSRIQRQSASIAHVGIEAGHLSLEMALRGRIALDRSRCPQHNQ